MLYRARYLLPLNGPPLEEAAVRVVDGRISQIGRIDELKPSPDEAVWEGQDHVLMPGLINSHAHLEMHHLRGQLPPGASFPGWVQALRQKTAGFSESDWTEGCRLGALESLRHGTTTLVDIGNTGSICAAVADLPFRVFACLEVLGLDPKLALEKWEQACLRWETTPNGPYLTKSIVPHSAYSVSMPLLQAVLRESQKQNHSCCYSIHAGESREEEALFANATGPLQAMCEAIYPSAPRHAHTTAIRYLAQNQLLSRRALIVHANGQACQDAEAIRPLDPLIVHCPQSHRFFGHPPFHAQAWQQAGIPVALGTDSLASGSSLSLWEAMRQFSENQPEVSAEDVLRMVTSVPGTHLAPADPLGVIAQGGRADLIAIRNQTTSKHIYEDMVRETHEVSLVVVGGEPVIC
jgi:aminodeoxyfutalosine deaminase